MSQQLDRPRTDVKLLGIPISQSIGYPALHNNYESGLQLGTGTGTFAPRNLAPSPLLLLSALFPDLSPPLDGH